MRYQSISTSTSTLSPWKATLLLLLLLMTLKSASTLEINAPDESATCPLDPDDTLSPIIPKPQNALEQTTCRRGGYNLFDDSYQHDLVTYRAVALVNIVRRIYAYYCIDKELEASLRLGQAPKKEMCTDSDPADKRVETLLELVRAEPQLRNALNEKGAFNFFDQFDDGTLKLRSIITSKGNIKNKGHRLYGYPDGPWRFVAASHPQFQAENFLYDMLIPNRGLPTGIRKEILNAEQKTLGQFLKIQSGEQLYLYQNNKDIIALLSLINVHLPHYTFTKKNKDLKQTLGVLHFYYISGNWSHQFTTTETKRQTWQQWAEAGTLLLTRPKQPILTFPGASLYHSDSAPINANFSNPSTAI